MSTNEHKAIIQRAMDAFNQGDWAAIDLLFAPHYIDHDRSRAALPPGPEGIKQAWRMFRAAFPDLTGTIEDMVAEGDKVAVRATLRGTQQGELLGIPTTGRQVTVMLIDINRIEAGTFVERWAETDMLGLLQQLGAVPAPSQSGA